jgi:hypothetical protein
MNLATLNAAINGLTDDGDSCRFFKRCQVMQSMTKAELVAIIEEIHQQQYPGTTCTGKRDMRAKKIDLMRFIDWRLEYQKRYDAFAAR